MPPIYIACFACEPESACGDREPDPACSIPIINPHDPTGVGTGISKSDARKVSRGDYD